MSNIQTPSMLFSGLYYPQIVQDLLVWKRINVPELSDEDPHEPFIQLLEGFALVGHNLGGVLCDHVAQEKMLVTSRLRNTVKGHLSLIGVPIMEEVPAIAPILIKLPSPILVPVTIPAYMVFSTLKTDALAEVPFETQEALVLSRGDQLSKAWEYDVGGGLPGAWTDRTADVNAPGAPFAPWPLGGAGGINGDMLYFGHDSVQWDRLVLIVPASWPNPYTSYGAWEYYDGQLDNVTPTAVVDPGGGVIQFNVNSLLGTLDRHGATVRVRCVGTGAYEDLVSTWDAGSGENRIVTAGLLGQAGPPSLVPTDYVVGSLWRELPDVLGVMPAADEMDITYTFPETVLRRWPKFAVNGVTCHWIRYRVVNAFAGKTLDSARIHDGKQYISTLGTQGLLQVGAPVGTSNGLSNQSFTGSRTDAISNSVRVYVNEGGGYAQWSVVLDMLSSTSVSNDCVVEFDDDGHPITTFGDGTNGRIPPLGASVKLEYRYGASDDGNVGANTITVNKSGSAYVHTVTNPRPGVGWQAAEGSTPEDLARLKVAGPASLRALSRALTSDDVETLAAAFVASDGSQPIARAWGREEGLGPKTVEVVCVGAGGAALPSEFLTEMGIYFNGDPILGTSGVLVLNSQATGVNYTPHVINVAVQVSGQNTINTLNIEAALRALINPLALEEDGLTWIHSFGGTVYVSRAVAECFKADVNVDNVPALTLNLGGDVVLATKELPVIGTLSVIQV